MLSPQNESIKFGGGGSLFALGVRTVAHVDNRCLTCVMMNSHLILTDNVCLAREFPPEPIAQDVSVSTQVLPLTLSAFAVSWKGTRRCLSRNTLIFKGTFLSDTKV